MWRHYRGSRINGARRPTALPGVVVSPRWHMPSCVVRGCAFVSARPLSPRYPTGHPCQRGPRWGDPLWVASVSDYMDHVGTAHRDLLADDLAPARLFRCPIGCGFVSLAEYLYWHVTGACRPPPNEVARWTPVARQCRAVQEQLEAEGPGSPLPLAAAPALRRTLGWVPSLLPPLAKRHTPAACCVVCPSGCGLALTRGAATSPPRHPSVPLTFPHPIPSRPPSRLSSPSSPPSPLGPATRSARRQAHRPAVGRALPTSVSPLSGSVPDHWTRPLSPPPSPHLSSPSPLPPPSLPSPGGSLPSASLTHNSLARWSVSDGDAQVRPLPLPPAIFQTAVRSFRGKLSRRPCL
jgi:hypothetical protein